MSNSKIEQRLFRPITDNISRVQQALDKQLFVCSCGFIAVKGSVGEYIFPGTLEGPNELVCRPCYSRKWKVEHAKRREEKANADAHN